MRPDFNNLLIDLDGTVIDSQPGIIRSLRLTFEKLGMQPPADEQLKWCIGPGIQQVVRNLFPDKDEAFIKQAISIFRADYDSEGFKGSELYPGIRELLQNLKQGGYRLFLTTMKAKGGVDKIVPWFELEPYFEAVYASDPYSSVRFKHELIGNMLRSESLAAAETAIIGDTYHDIEAGRKNGLFTIGITWGFGTEDQLQGAGADRIYHDMEELQNALLI